MNMGRKGGSASQRKKTAAAAAAIAANRRSERLRQHSTTTTPLQIDSREVFPPLCPLLSSPTQTVFDAETDQNERTWKKNEEGDDEYECSDSDSEASFYGSLPSPSVEGGGGGGGSEGRRGGGFLPEPPFPMPEFASSPLHSAAASSFPQPLNAICPSPPLYDSPSMDASSPTSAASPSPSQ